MIRVLIAEDDKLARKGLISIMPWEKYNMRVVGDVPNGAKALEFIQNNEVDLIFVDLAMPIISGIELMKKVKKLYKNINFVVLTFYQNFEYIQTALRLGALDYISKAELEYENYDKIFERITQKINEKNQRIEFNELYPLTDEYNQKCEIEVCEDIWEKIKHDWYQLYWLYDDDVFENLCLEIEKNKISTRYVERLFVELLMKIELTTGICKENFPEVKNTKDALEWIKEYRKSLYDKAVKSTDLTNISVCIMKAKIFVRENISKKILQEDVASYVNMSRSYFSQNFRKFVGITFSDYLKNERVNLAKKLLLESDQPLVDIAQAVGYEDVKYFSHIFHERVNMTPLQFRQQFSIQDDDC